MYQNPTGSIDVPEEDPTQAWVNDYPLPDRKTTNPTRKFSKITPINREEVIAPPLEATDIVEVLHTKYEPLKWIIPNLLPEGLTALFANPKVGKSMMALALALRMGRRVSGGIDGHVLYLSLDDTSQRRLQDRTRDLLQGNPIEQGRLWAAFTSASLDSGLIGQLEGWMQRDPETCLIIIDVFGAVKPKRQGDDIFKGDYESLKSLRDFAAAHRIAILMLHHTRKQPDTNDWINKMSGSTGLTAAVDTLWMLKRERGSEEMQLYTTGRDVRDQVIDLTLEDIDAPWAIRGEDAEDEDAISDGQQRILAVMRENGNAMSPKSIAAKTGQPPKSVSRLLCRMASDSLIAKCFYGSYALCEESGKVRQSTTSTTKSAACDFVVLSQETLPTPLQSVEPSQESTTSTTNADSAHYEKQPVPLVVPARIPPTHEKHRFDDLVARGFTPTCQRCQGSRYQGTASNPWMMQCVTCDTQERIAAQ